MGIPVVILAKARIHSGLGGCSLPLRVLLVIPSIARNLLWGFLSSFSRRRESTVARGMLTPPSRAPCHSEHSEESLMGIPVVILAKARIHSGLGGCSLPPSRTPCHSERSEESPPLRTAYGGQGDAQAGTGGENHGNHYPIMAIMVHTPLRSA